jgi:hypothetical protein
VALDRPNAWIGIQLSEQTTAIASRSAESSFMENQDSLHSPLGFIMTMGMVLVAVLAIGTLLYVIV